MHICTEVEPRAVYASVSAYDRKQTKVDQPKAYILLLRRFHGHICPPPVWSTFDLVKVEASVTELDSTALASIICQKPSRAGKVNRRVLSPVVFYVGAYYMISRSLGPKVGTPIGVIFGVRWRISALSCASFRLFVQIG